MNPIVEWLGPVAGVACLLSAALLSAGSAGARAGVRKAGTALFALSLVALVASLALPALVPARSAIVRGDGTTEDPRVLATLIAGVAASVALLPALRSLRLPAMGMLGAILPGVALAGLLAALAYFAGLRQPLAVVTVLLGGLALGCAIVLALRSAREPSEIPLLLQALGAAVLVVGGSLSLQGARTGPLRLAELSPVDTLGLRVTLTGVESSPAGDRYVMALRLQGPRDSLVLRPVLAGPRGSGLRPRADGAPWSGPIALPLAIQEHRAHAHDLQWLGRGDSLVAGRAVVRFSGFRIEHTDSIRMFADLDVTTPEGTQRVSPGVLASSAGEVPFAANARGLGPVVVARFDPDNHRVGLMLPQVSAGALTHLAALDLRLRPALPLAWAGMVLALAGFIWGLAAPAPGAQRY